MSQPWSRTPSPIGPPEFGTTPHPGHDRTRDPDQSRRSGCGPGLARNSGRYRYDGVVLHQGTVRVNASRLDSKSWLFNHPDRMLLSDEFAEAFFGSDPHQWIALVHCARCRVEFESTDTKCCWQYHLDQLLLAPQPLKYLEAFL